MPLIHDGKTYARVSDVIAPYTDFSGIPDAVLENKAKIGTEVHDAIDLILQDELPIFSDKARPYVESFLKWKNQVSPTFSFGEKRLFCQEKMVTGRIDGLVLMPNSTIPMLVDYKTSVQESKAWVMQAHLYYYLLKSNGYVVANSMIFVKLDKFSGLPKCYLYSYNSNTNAQCMEAISKYWKNNACPKL